MVLDYIVLWEAYKRHVIVQSKLHYPPDLFLEVSRIDRKTVDFPNRNRHLFSTEKLSIKKVQFSRDIYRFAFFPNDNCKQSVYWFQNCLFPLNLKTRLLLSHFFDDFLVTFFDRKTVVVFRQKNCRFFFKTTTVELDRKTVYKKRSAPVQ